MSPRSGRSTRPGSGFTLEAIKLVRRELSGRAGVIGFSGAPFTLACYLIEGRPSRDYALAKAFMFREPDAWHALMEHLSEMVVAYLRAQVDAGAEVVQLFDSWVGGLAPDDYATFVQPHVRRIFDRLGDVPTIHFGTGTAALLERMAEAGGDVIGIDQRQSLRRRMAPGRLRPGHPGKPRRGPAAGRLGGDRGWRPPGPRGGGRAARPYLQPGPRGPAGDRHRAAPASRRVRP